MMELMTVETALMRFWTNASRLPVNNFNFEVYLMVNLKNLYIQGAYRTFLDLLLHSQIKQYFL